MSLLDVHAPHPHLRSRATAVVVAAHVAVALLLAFDKARYGTRPRGTLGAAADHPAWVAIHAAAAVLVILAVRAGRVELRRAALFAAFGVMFGWAALMLAWAITLEPDGTWAVGAFGLTLSALAFVLAHREE